MGLTPNLAIERIMVDGGNKNEEERTPFISIT
jgi:hypothetical protein